VPLDLAGKNRRLVGLGSYLVNAVGDCNGCHSDGTQTEYAKGGNPYFGQKPAIVNPKTYLGGGRDFGQFPGPGPFPHIISRNLTPDKTGRAEGGNTFAQFKAIIRTGIDTDNVIRPVRERRMANASRLPSMEAFCKSCPGRSTKT
jgi:hypothetical protein